MANSDALPQLLARCTTRLLTSGSEQNGTGFFVAPGTLLTCAHVVSDLGKGRDTLQVQWNEQLYPATVAETTDEIYPDLALITVQGLTDHPCVYLHEQVSLSANDELYTYGYPPPHYTGDSIISKYVGPANQPQTLLTFTESNVRPGFSGSPLLNLRTGAVCGVIKRTMGENTSLGGRGVPIALAFQAFPDLKRRQEQYHRQDTPWGRSLTAQQRKLNGLSEIQAIADNKPIEIFFSYHDNEADKRILHALELQLSQLKRSAAIKAWHTGMLALSVAMEEETLQHLNTAQIICLLISPDYIADDRLYDTHITRAMERWEQERTTVIPILARPTDDWETTLFGKLQAIPRNKKPISLGKNLDQISLEVAREIRKIVESLKKPIDA